MSNHFEEEFEEEFEVVSMEDEQGNETEFMFLSYVNAKTSTVFQKSFYWLQTHDLYGKDVEYTPIAAFVDTVVEGGVEKSWAFGWFGGHYDGNDYTIQDLEITTSDINTTGLFGLTVDAELKNIILYSSDGKGVIQSQNEKDNWYAMGGIVGLAANTVGSNGSIQNCAVAGYNINDNNKACAFGGGGVGGAANGAVHHNGVLKGLPGEDLARGDALLHQGENAPPRPPGSRQDIPHSGGHQRSTGQRQA